jgi:RNA:NAD 2'-phosphotransferase (TPT1/KptA family)
LFEKLKKEGPVTYDFKGEPLGIRLFKADNLPKNLIHATGKESKPSLKTSGFRPSSKEVSLRLEKLNESI